MSTHLSGIFLTSSDLCVDICRVKPPHFPTIHSLQLYYCLQYLPRPYMLSALLLLYLLGQLRGWWAWSRSSIVWLVQCATDQCWSSLQHRRLDFAAVDWQEGTFHWPSDFRDLERSVCWFDAACHANKRTTRRLERNYMNDVCLLMPLLNVCSVPHLPNSGRKRSNKVNATSPHARA